MHLVLLPNFRVTIQRKESRMLRDLLRLPNIIWMSRITFEFLSWQYLSSRQFTMGTEFRRLRYQLFEWTHSWGERRRFLNGENIFFRFFTEDDPIFFQLLHQRRRWTQDTGSLGQMKLIDDRWRSDLGLLSRRVSASSEEADISTAKGHKARAWNCLSQVRN